MPYARVTDANDSRLDDFRSLKNAPAGRAQIVVEGSVLVKYLIESRFAVQTVVISDDWWDELHGLVDQDQVDVWQVPTEVMHELVGFSFHRGVLASARDDEPLVFDDWLARLPSTASLAICPQLEDPSNLGALIRNAHALGVTGVLLGPKTPSPLSRRVIRVSTGSALFLPVFSQGQALLDNCRQLIDAGFELVALESSVDRDACVSLHRVATRPRRIAFMFGSEAHGLASDWRSLCSHSVRIEMDDAVDSLNVSAASAVVFHHFRHHARENP